MKCFVVKMPFDKLANRAVLLFSIISLIFPTEQVLPICRVVVTEPFNAELFLLYICLVSYYVSAEYIQNEHFCRKAYV